MAGTYDLIVIGAGAAGLTAAGGAAMLGLRVALVEQGAMGGDCLNTGCVPSKATIAAAARAHHARADGALGVRIGPPHVDFQSVRAHVERAIATIAPEDSQQRFESLGVEVIRSHACFVDDRTIDAGGRRLSAPRIVVATGSRPAVPDIPGLDDVRHLTNETLFGIDDLPRHLAIIGGGPIGVEMAQAFRRLGSDVTLVEHDVLLWRDDREATQVVTDALTREGVAIETGVSVDRIARSGADIALSMSNGRRVTASHLLVAAGRVANVTGLGLDQVGVRCGANGILVDPRRRTSNHRIFAIGDCRDGPRFTHVSGYEGSIVTINVALGWPAKVDWRALPHVTYTDPELAQVGLTEAAARRKYGRIDVVRQDFAKNDRAIVEGATEGFLKLIRHRRQVVGVTIVGRHAGDLLLPWSQAIAGKASTFGLGGTIVAYPGRAEISKAAAFRACKSTIFGPWPRRWAQLLAWTRR